MGRPTFDVMASANEGDEQAMVHRQHDDSRIVVLHGEVNEQSIASVIAHLFYLAGQNHKPIHLTLSTYGGSVDEMFTLYDAIKFLPCPIHTVALGKVMSAGVLLLASGVKGHRLIGQSARIMIHPSSAGHFGNIFEVEAEVKEHKRLESLMISALMRETKMTRKDVARIMKVGHNYYITPKEAISLGIVDRIIGGEADAAESV